MAANSQAKRNTKLLTTLGPDALQLRQFDGTDFVDDLFEYSVEAQTDDLQIDLDSLLGTHATVVMEDLEFGVRHFDGIITNGRWVANRGDIAVMRLTMRPWFYLLGQRRNQRIFHEKDVNTILSELFEPYSGLGQPAFEMKLNETYPNLEYTVQYRESDLDFARRMMERFGLSFYFKHEEGSHTLVITDNIDGYPMVSGESRDFLEVQAGHDADKEHFWLWQKARNMTTGAVRLKDFNFKQPTAMMEVDRVGKAKYEEGTTEAYDFPGDYLTESEGKPVVARRVTQERGQDHRHYGEGDCATLGAGMKVKLTGQAPDQVNDKIYLCLSATHTFSSEKYVSGGQSEDTTFRASYTFVPKDEPYAPERKTKQALVYGPQTAMVVGEGEIHCDEYGRVKVQFHWDLHASFSMWCRVSQNWAGNGWGGMVIPRIGMEVLVEFLEGDPDKPLVTGCVYNGKNDVPYKLPENKTVSTFRTDTHQGEGFNELRFEDKKDKEEIFVHGQKDMNTKIENNMTERVNVNKVESVGNNRASETENNESNVIGGDWEIFVGPGQKGRHTPGGASDNDQGIGGEGYGLGDNGAAPRGSGNLQLTVEKNRSEDIGIDDSVVVGKNKNANVGKNYNIEVADSFTLDVGKKITLKCGQSVVTLDQAGNIKVNGVKITLNANSLIKAMAAMVKIN